MHGQSTLYDYWMALYSRKKIIFSVALSAMLASVVVSFYLPPVFEAKASFYVPANSVSPSYTHTNQYQLAQPLLKPLPDEKEAGIHVGILKSTDMAENMRALFPEKEIGFFKKNVDFVTSPQMFIDIYVRDRDPNIAAAVANSYILLYKAFHMQFLKTTAGQEQHVLESQLEGLEKQISAKSAELENFQRSNDIVSSGETEELLLRQTQELQHELDMTIVDLKSMRIHSVLPEDPISDKASGYGGGSTILNPEFARVKKLEARKSALIERMAKLQQTTRGSIGTMSIYHKLKGEKKTLEDLRANVERNLIEARLQKEFPAVDIVQTQVAKAPKDRAFPIFTLNGIVALLFGFVAGCYNALFLEYLKRLKLDRIRANLDETPFREVNL